MRVCVYMSVYKHAYIYIYMCVCVYTDIRTYLCTFNVLKTSNQNIIVSNIGACVCILVCVCAHMYTHITFISYIYIYIYIYVFFHVCICFVCVRVCNISSSTLDAISLEYWHVLHHACFCAFLDMSIPSTIVVDCIDIWFASFICSSP